MARQLLSLLGSLTILSLSLGCEPPPTDELLHITFGNGAMAPPVELDIYCGNGGCERLTEVEADLTFESHELASVEADVEILQYRISYQLAPPHDGVDVPYFAGDTSVRVGIGETASFNVVVAGDRQRNFVGNRHPSERVDGTATITLAGYDHNNEQVLPEASFDIFFDDFVVGVGN